MSMIGRLEWEAPTLAPALAAAARFARAAICLGMIVVAVVILRSAAYGYFHGDDRPLKAILGLFGG